MSVRVVPPAWTLQPFEMELAAIEAERLSGSKVERREGAIYLTETLTSAAISRLAKRFSFARAIESPRGRTTTLQHGLELAAGGGSRKVTSHALHGLHPYKGKFYPQLARSLLNVCDVRTGGLVLDPFAGCGTSVLEASLLGIRGVGVDANPMATLVSQAKLSLLGCPVDEVRRKFLPLRQLRGSAPPLPDEDYLSRWFPEENLAFLRSAVARIRELECPTARDGATVALSSVMRDASWQDPKQLRVGRRKSGESIPPLADLFYAALDKLVEELASIQAVPGLRWQRIPKLGSRVFEGDSRRLFSIIRPHVRRKVDAVVTSPPYANALPYVDTDRLSLRAFGLLPQGSQRLAEGRLIGNREITEGERRATEEELMASLARPGWMPASLREVLLGALEVASEPDSGFRKRRTPALLFAYFRDMRDVLEQLQRLVKPGGSVAIVIGDNTVAGPSGETLRVPTADIFAELAEGVGLTLKEDLSKRLTSYGAPETVHQRNAMDSERVLLFRLEERPV